MQEATGLLHKQTSLLTPKGPQFYSIRLINCTLTMVNTGSASRTSLQVCQGNSIRCYKAAAFYIFKRLLKCKNKCNCLRMCKIIIVMKWFPELLDTRKRSKKVGKMEKIHYIFNIVALFATILKLVGFGTKKFQMKKIYDLL